MIGNYLFLCFAGIISTCFTAETNENVEFPYLVSVQAHTKEYRRHHICTGAIISEKAILTAANCVVGNTNRIRVDLLSIVTGINGSLSAKEDLVIGEVKIVYVLNKYKPAPLNVNYVADIAVLRLNESLKLWPDSRLKAIQLPKTRIEAYGGKTVDVTSFGWDWIERGDLINLTQCQANFPKQKLSSDVLCIKVYESPDGSNNYGDIGGPLVRDGTVVGILSKIPNIASEKIHAAICTKVAEYFTFIKNAINGKWTRYMKSPKILF